MQIDYDSVDWTFVSRILEENSRRLSRTHHGKSDTGSSALKRPLLLSGQELQERARANECAVHRFIFESRRLEIVSPLHVRDVLIRIADLTNDGLLPEGRFRTWPIEANQRSVDGLAIVSGIVAKALPAEIPNAVDEFCKMLWCRWGDLLQDPIPVAAWAEWELNGGRLHPFYDGCGRISRSFAAALLVRAGWLLPLFTDGDTYFTEGNRGADAFIEYYRSSIGACRSWLDRRAGWGRL